MKFEKKEPEVRIQPFNPHKNPWSRCRCMDCGIPYGDGSTSSGYYFDEKKNLTMAWHGESISSGHLWQCAKCVFETKVKCGAIEEKENDT